MRAKAAQTPSDAPSLSRVEPAGLFAGGSSAGGRGGLPPSVFRGGLGSRARPFSARFKRRSAQVDRMRQRRGADRRAVGRRSISGRAVDNAGRNEGAGRVVDSGGAARADGRGGLPSPSAAFLWRMAVRVDDVSSASGACAASNVLSGGCVGGGAASQPADQSAGG